MPTSIEVKGGSFSWLTYERRNWLSLAFVAAMAGYGLGNGHTTTSAVEHISYQLGDTKHQASCEHKRADKATAVAKQAIKSATIDAIPIPSPAAVPTDNCDHATK